jgi:hypothetical protein
MARTKLLKNKKMDDATFELRKQVMKVIYEARQVIGKQNFPRITVRITHNNGSILGVARMGQNIIWIPEKLFKGENKLYLREVVYHELCHALWAINHNETCPLMRSSVGSRPLNKEQCESIFNQYWKRQGA